MTTLKITAGPYAFTARMEEARSPQTCTAFARHLPFVSKLVHVRWSGEATWIPLGDLDFEVGFEDPTCYPSPGQMLLYPGFAAGGVSETEILLPYGGTSFASTAGLIPGNHFLTIEEGAERLRALGETTLWEGAQEIRFERL